MPTVRIKHHNRDYTCIQNATLRDRKLSFKARGIHHLLLSYPDNWVINTNQIVKESDKDGRESVASGLKELIEHGYLVRRKIHNPATGHFIWENELHETPVPESDDTEPFTGNPLMDDPCDGKTINGKTVNGKTINGKTINGKPPHIISTDQLSTDQLSTDQTSNKIKKECDFSFSENFEPTEPTEPSKQSSPVNPQVQAETLSQVKPTVEDKYSAARKYSPEEIKGNPTLRADLIMRTGGYKLPELIAAGLEAVWIGPGYQNFEPGVVSVAQQYLKTIKLPSEHQNAINYLTNLIRDNKWANLECFLDASRERASRQSAPPSPAPDPVSAAPKQLSPEELEARRKGIEIARSRFKNGAA